jgi:ketosteroid isomerase-like protein
MFNIFEYPFVGLGIAVLSMMALWLYNAFYPAGRKWWHFTIPFVIAGAAFAIAFFVQTDKEKIQAAVYAGIRAFEKQDIKPISEIIADDYNDFSHGSKEQLIAYCRTLFQFAAVEKVTTFSREMKVYGQRGIFRTEMMVKFAEDSDIAEAGKAFLIVKARFYFKKTPQGKWVIYNSEILELDRQPVNREQLRG